MKRVFIDTNVFIDWADCIITRDKKHFALSEKPVMTPIEFLDMLTK